MANNLRKGSKVSFPVAHGHKRTGTVTRKLTDNGSTLVFIKSQGQNFSKRPRQVKRI